MRVCCATSHLPGLHSKVAQLRSNPPCNRRKSRKLQLIQKLNLKLLPQMPGKRPIKLSISHILSRPEAKDMSLPDQAPSIPGPSASYPEVFFHPIVLQAIRKWRL